MTMGDSIKRWTAKRKTALVIEIIQGKTTVAEASPFFRPDAFRGRGRGLGREAGHGEFSARQPARHSRAIREAVDLCENLPQFSVTP